MEEQLSSWTLQNAIKQEQLGCLRLQNILGKNSWVAKLYKIDKVRTVGLLNCIN